MQTIRVTVRRDRMTGGPILFFRNSNSRGRSWTEGFCRSEGHFECSDYGYYKLCAPMPPDDPDAVQLARFWESIGPVRYRVVIGRRLPR